MSDRIAVMSQGVIQQVGTGTEVYENSQTAFVASFVGENNPFTGKVVAADGGHAVVETAFGPLRGRNLGGLGAGSHAMLFVRPESLGLVNGHAPAENVIESQEIGRASCRERVCQSV